MAHDHSGPPLALSAAPLWGSLGGARITSRTIELWDVDGSVLMRLPVEDPAVRQALRMQLSGLVHVSD